MVRPRLKSSLAARVARAASAIILLPAPAPKSNSEMPMSWGVVNFGVGLRFDEVDGVVMVASSASEAWVVMEFLRFLFKLLIFDLLIELKYLRGVAQI